MAFKFFSFFHADAADALTHLVRLFGVVQLFTEKLSTMLVHMSNQLFFSQKDDGGALVTANQAPPCQQGVLAGWQVD